MKHPRSGYSMTTVWLLSVDTRNSPSAPGGHFPTHLPATAAAPASSGSCFEIRASPLHGPCGSKCRGLWAHGPPNCHMHDLWWGKWWWSHFKVPYIPMTQSLVTHQDAPLGPDVRHARHLQADPAGLPGLANVQTDPLVQVYMGQNGMSLT